MTRKSLPFPEFFDLLAGAGPRPGREIFKTLLKVDHASSLRFELISSNRCQSGPGFWYDQDETEWVSLIKGKAQIEWESGKITKLSRGQGVLIPAGCRHRVAKTSAKAVWLAVFWLADHNPRST